MSNKSENYYTRRLQRYFDKHYKDYEETAEYYVNPAINQWRFYIPELGYEVILTCDFYGGVAEVRKYLKKEAENHD